MKQVLFVGQEPETVDFSDPALPPGLDAAKIHSGIAIAMKQMSERGWQADLCLVRPDESAGTVLERHLQKARLRLCRDWRRNSYSAKNPAVIRDPRQCCAQIGPEGVHRL